MQKTGFSETRLRRLSEVLQGYVDREEIAGAVTIVHRKGEEAYSDAIGWQDKEARIPAQRDTLFRIMSMTKPITAVAAMLLVEEGKMRLFDPVHAWLPELASLVVLRDPKGRLDDVVPLDRPITLHDLLTSRFGTGWDDHQLQSEVMKLLPAPLAIPLGAQHAEVHLDPDSWMKRLAELPLLYQPGTRFLYHISHEVLGVLIARVSGQTLDEFFRERIFEPIGMRDTYFKVPREKQGRLSVAYAPKDGGGLLELERPESTGWAEIPLFLSGGAGLISTADDYQRFGRMLLGYGELDKVRILSRRSVEAMITDHLTPEQRAHPFFDETDYDGSMMRTNRGYGYGVSVRTRQIGIGPSEGAFFWPGALGSTWIADPREELMVTLMIQLRGAMLPKNSMIAHDFWTMIYQAMTD